MDYRPGNHKSLVNHNVEETREYVKRGGVSKELIKPLEHVFEIYNVTKERGLERVEDGDEAE